MSDALPPTDRSPATASGQQGLPPVWRADARILLLGSFPGTASLAARAYYAHPRNQFWPILGALLDVPMMDLPYEQRLEQLRVHRIALWDTVGHCQRQGSLDSNIRHAIGNEFRQLLASLPALRGIGLDVENRCGCGHVFGGASDHKCERSGGRSDHSARNWGIDIAVSGGSGGLCIRLRLTDGNRGGIDKKCGGREGGDCFLHHAGNKLAIGQHGDYYARPFGGFRHALLHLHAGRLGGLLGGFRNVEPLYGVSGGD